jgi:hypothetical protein
MRAQKQEQRGPSGRDSRARLGAVKTPRVARPRLRRAGGLDRASVEPWTASVDGPARPWPGRVSPSLYGTEARMRSASSAPCILVTIGQETRIYHAFVTSAPCQLDAPSTMTLHTSTLGDVAGFAADELGIDQASIRSSARLVLVDAMDLAWQRARCRESGHLLAPADSQLVGRCTLQRWLWRRLCAPRSDAQQ